MYAKWQYNPIDKKIQIKCELKNRSAGHIKDKLHPN